MSQTDIRFAKQQVPSNPKRIYCGNAYVHTAVTSVIITVKVWRGKEKDSFWTVMRTFARHSNSLNISQIAASS